MYLLIHTCYESSSDWLTPTLVPEGHQVNSILLPWSQTSLHKGSDGAGQLCSHPSIIVLGKTDTEVMQCKDTVTVTICCFAYFE